MLTTLNQLGRNNIALFMVVIGSHPPKNRKLRQQVLEEEPGVTSEEGWNDCISSDDEGRATLDDMPPALESEAEKEARHHLPHYPWGYSFRFFKKGLCGPSQKVCPCVSSTHSSPRWRDLHDLENALLIMCLIPVS